MFLCEKTTKYEEKTQTKSAKTAISDTCPVLRTGKIFFLQNGFQLLFSSTNAHLCAKKLEKSNDKISRKSQKIAFFGTFPALVTGKNFFLENPAPSHFGYHHFASLCKISEKTNEPITRKASNRQTDERTDKG